MTAYMKDVAALIVIVAFIASVGVAHETVRLLM
jgi:multisubunit Na+/H+ antiporter MnhF subunit